MSCTSPLFRVDEKFFPSTYSKKGKGFVNGGLIFGRDEYDKISSIVGERNIVKIRCGSCIDCRLDYSRKWAIRCMLESEQHEYNYFVTLTYDDLHLPRGEFLDISDGEVKDSSLFLPDVQNFIKRLRINCKRFYNHDGVRVFYSGEYGSIFDRPHYHLLLFNMPELTDSFLWQRKNNYDIYRNSFIEDTWSDRNRISFGFSTLSEVNFDTCAYTARYMMKKQRGESIKLANRLDLPDGMQLRSNCFAHQSRKPGLAREWYEQHKDDIYETDSVPYYKDYQVYRSKPPRYFDQLFDIENHDIMEKIKQFRQDLAYESTKLNRIRYSESDFSRLAREDEINMRKEMKRMEVL